MRRLCIHKIFSEFLFCCTSKPISRVMSLSDHLSRPSVAERLKRPTWKHDGPPYRFLLGLASNGVYMCPACYQDGGSLLHCLSTLTSASEAVYFCCTGLGVTSTGRYPASCPVKPGLSSSGTFRPASRDHLPYSQDDTISYPFIFVKQILWSLYLIAASSHKFS